MSFSVSMIFTVPRFGLSNMKQIITILPIVFLLAPPLSKLLFHSSPNPVGPDWSNLALSLAFLYIPGVLISLLFLGQKDTFKLKHHSLGKGILIIYLLFHSCYWIDWLSHLSWTMRDTSIKLRQQISSTSVVMGSVSDTLCLENKGFAFASFDVDVDLFYNADPIKRFKPDYYITIYKIEGSLFPEKYLPTFQPQPTFQERVGVLPDRDGKPRALIDIYAFQYRKMKNSRDFN